MTTIQITARFATVLEALQASSLDISYKPDEATRKATDLGRPHPRHGHVTEAFLCEDGTVRFLYTCPDGLTVLNTFEPFWSCMDDSPFTVVHITADAILITDAKISKRDRKDIIKVNLTVA